MLCSQVFRQKWQGSSRGSWALSLVMLAVLVLTLTFGPQPAQAATKTYSLDTSNYSYGPTEAGGGKATMALQAKLERRLDAIKYSSDKITVKTNKQKKTVTVTYRPRAFSFYNSKYPSDLKDDKSRLASSIRVEVNAYRYGGGLPIRELSFYESAYFWKANPWDDISYGYTTYTTKDLGNAKKAVYVQLQTRFEGRVYKYTKKQYARQEYLSWSGGDGEETNYVCTNVRVLKNIKVPKGYKLKFDLR